MEITEFLTRLSGVKGGPDKYTARCPAHEDHTNSLSVSKGDDGRILLHCHAGCSLSAILDIMHLPATVLFPAKPPTERMAGEVDLQNCNKSEVTTGETVYLYSDDTGIPLFEVVRKPGKQFLQRRWDNGKYIYNLRDITPVLYRLPQVRQEVETGDGQIFLCEGEKDANRLAALGFCATTAPMGAGKWRNGYTESLRGAQRVAVVPDNDVPGRKHALSVCTALDEAGIPVAVVDLCTLWPELPEKGDVSDFLDRVGEGAAGRLLQNPLSPAAFRAVCLQREHSAVEPLVPYRFETASTFVRTAFLSAVARTAAQTAISTGFTALDAQLEGHLYPGLYVVGSVSSLGKTAFCLQMADHIAQNGQDVLFFTLEMSQLEMVARSLTRRMFVESRFTSGCGVGALLRGKADPQALQEAMDAYADGPGGHLALLEGGAGGASVEDVAKTALRHREATGQSPVVFVDYLQILRPAHFRMSDKQAMDANVTALKRLSRELESPVVTVSSFNRQNYTEAVNLASFKESGAIEYSADFVLGLQARGIHHAARPELDEKKAARVVNAATVDAKKKDPRPVEAVTLKNRRGPAWACFDLDFYPRQNFFVEG